MASVNSRLDELEKAAAREAEEIDVVIRYENSVMSADGQFRQVPIKFAEYRVSDWGTLHDGRRMRMWWPVMGTEIPARDTDSRSVE